MKLWLLSVSLFFVTACGHKPYDMDHWVGECKKVSPYAMVVLERGVSKLWFKECWIPTSNPMTLEEIENWRPR